MVEDDPAQRNALCALLELEGFYWTAACNGREALDLLRRNGAPDLVLLDLSMPVMGGCEFRVAQLADGVLSGIPVLILSADRPSDLEQSLRPAGFLRKPIDCETLLGEVRRFCAPESTLPEA
ncbi:MAG: response regulator [Thermoanaerobaculia bacterium]|nr:response regulator [Acidobacteriota bacterium]